MGSWRWPMISMECYMYDNPPPLAPDCPRVGFVCIGGGNPIPRVLVDPDMRAFSGSARARQPNPGPLRGCFRHPRQGPSKARQRPSRPGKTRQNARKNARQNPPPKPGKSGSLVKTLLCTIMLCCWICSWMRFPLHMCYVLECARCS